MVLADMSNSPGIRYRPKMSKMRSPQYLSGMEAQDTSLHRHDRGSSTAAWNAIREAKENSAVAATQP